MVSSIALCASGDLDTSFVASLDDQVYACSVNPVSGKIVVAGAFTQAGSLVRHGIAALNSDGSVDGSFYLYPSLTGTVYCFAIQPDGKTVLAETFYSSKSGYSSTVKRLLINGTTDATFPAISLNGRANSIALQPDGKILVGGSYTTVNGLPPAYLARFSSSGVLDGTFYPNPNGSVKAVACDDVSVVIGGEFTQVVGAARNNFAWLFSNGSLHTLNGGTSTPEANSFVSALRMESGYAYLGGNFTLFKDQTQTRSKVAAIDNYGVLSFWGSATPILPTTGVVLALAGSSTSHYAGGFFNFTYLGINYQNVVRYNGGHQDLGFSAGSIDDVVNTIFVQADGKVLIGGDFTSVQGQARNRLARLMP